MSELSVFDFKNKRLHMVGIGGSSMSGLARMRVTEGFSVTGSDSQEGYALDEKTGGPRVSERMETSVSGIFACGNVYRVYDLVDHVTTNAQLAGKSAAQFAGGKS